VHHRKEATTTLRVRESCLLKHSALPAKKVAHESLSCHHAALVYVTSQLIPLVAIPVLKVATATVLDSLSAMK
jgi:hypothetical protein